MATINNPTEINNNTPNAGTEIQASIETLYQNDLSLNSELVSKGAGSLGFISGTLSDAIGSTSRSDVINYPTSGNWLFLIQAGVMFAPNGQQARIRINGSSPSVEILFLPIGYDNANGQTGFYFHNASSIQLDFFVESGSSIQEIRYFAIRIS